MVKFRGSELVLKQFCNNWHMNFLVTIWILMCECIVLIACGTMFYAIVLIINFFARRVNNYIPSFSFFCTHTMDSLSRNVLCQTKNNFMI